MERMNRIGLARFVYTLALLVGASASTPATSHEGVEHDIERVSQALAEDPERVDLLLERAYYYGLAGRGDDALADLARAEHLEPANPRVALQRGFTLAQLGRNTEAEAELTRAIEAGAGGAGAYQKRAQLRLASTRPELALADFNQAIALQPTASLYLERGSLLESLGHWDEAAAGYRAGIESVGRVHSLRRGLIRVERMRGRHDEALRLIDEEIAEGSLAFVWHVERAKVLTELEKSEEAQRDLDRALAEVNTALRRRPTAGLLVARARVYLARGELEAARRDLEAALRKSPRYKPASALLAELETTPSRASDSLSSPSPE